MDSPGSPGRLSGLFARYVALSQRHTGLLLGVLALLALLTLYPIAHLELHTDLVELLPENHPAVQALRGIAGRQKSASNLVLLIQSPDGEKNRLFAEALRPQLTAMIPDVFTEIQWRPESEIPDFARRWRWMFMDPADLASAEDLLDRIVARRRSPLLVDLEGDPEEELKSLRKRLDQRLPVKNESAYFAGTEGASHFLGVMLWRRRDGFGTVGDHQTLAAVQATIKRLSPASFHPQMQIHYTGQIAEAIDEQNGVREDVTLATVICTTLVLLAIYLYFRRVGLLLVIGAPAVLGVLLSLALARLTIHYLNINTAFLISIILGNGINTPIVLLARYGEERRGDVPVPESLVTAMSATLLGTGTAMAAASISYGCLLLTSFRGFNQFGLIGGAGMLLVWTLSFLMVPPLVLWGERLRPGSLTPRRNLWRLPFDQVGRLADRHPRGLLFLAFVLLCAAALPMKSYVADPLEWNFDNLRSETTESQKWWGRMEALGMGDVGAGYIGNDGVLLVDRPDQADTVAEAMRKQDRALGKDHMLKEVRTLNSILPKNQDQQLFTLARLRAKIDRNRDLMSDKEWQDVQDFRPPDYLRRLVPDDLPRQVREAFTEVDGQRGRLIGIDADSQNFYGWNGHHLLRIARSLRVQAMGKTWVAASASTVFAGMLETIIKDGPRVTLIALAGVTLLVLLAFGTGAFPVLASLAVGIMWLLGLAGALKLKINFMNFVALPITLGVGADYAANIWARLRTEGAGRVRAIIADTGSAVALCSTTTIIGYSSLLLARNRALRSFGLLADLGEVACLLAAVDALPALIRVVQSFGRNQAGS